MTFPFARWWQLLFLLLPLVLPGCGSENQSKSAEVAEVKTPAPAAKGSQEPVGGGDEADGGGETLAKEPSNVPADGDSDPNAASEPPPVLFGPRVQPEVTPSVPTFSSRSEAEIRDILRKTNSSYTGGGRFHLDEAGKEIIAALLPSCRLKDLSALKGLKLVEIDLSDNPVADLRFLRGMPIQAMYLEKTAIVELSPLKGMPLRELWLNECSNLRSLEGLEGAPLQKLYLTDTQVADLTPLKGMPLQGLWLTGSPVTDLKPLKNSPLVSLTLHRTPISDLSGLRDLPRLQRVHVGETQVTDLTPLKGLALTRLVFTPSRIEKGIAVARSLPRIQQIGTHFLGGSPDDDLLASAAFWARYDAGVFK